MDKREAYSILSDLIFKGFLTADLDIDGRLFVFKTVNEKEFDLMKMMAGGPVRPDYQIRFNVYFLIYSLFFVGNKNILMERERNLEEFYDLFMKMPEMLFRKIIANLNGLRYMSFDSLKYLEGFSYTNVSRNNWKLLGNSLPTASEYTGIPGTTGMGLNVHQENWMLINRMLDSEESYNRNFSMALMVASASNPKGARNIRGQHETNIKNAEDRRKKLAEEGSIDVKKQWKPEGWAAPVDTVEELVAELDRQMHGVKDRHDVFIEEYLREIREEADKRKKEAEEHMKELQKKYGDVFIEGSQRILNPEESKNLIHKSPSNRKLEETGTDQTKFLKKIGPRVLTGRGK